MKTQLPVVGYSVLGEFGHCVLFDLNIPFYEPFSNPANVYLPCIALTKADNYVFGGVCSPVCKIT